MTDRRHETVEDLLARARGGDAGAETLLFAKLQARIAALAEKRIWDREAARDIAQETLRTAFEKYRDASLERGLYPWLFTILHHKIGNYIKHRRSEHDRRVSWSTAFGTREPAAVEDAGAIELRASLAVALPNLSAECRKVFRLLLGGASRQDLGAAFAGEPMGTIDSRISRCRSKLLAFLEGSIRKRTQ